MTNGKLRVLHIDTERTWRGGEQQLVYLASELQKYPEQIEAQWVACQPGSALSQRCQQQSIPLFNVRMCGEWDLLAVWKLVRFIRQHAIQLVHAHTAHAHTLALLAARRCGVKCIAARRVDFKPRGMGPIKRWKYHGVDHIIAVSHAIKEVLQSAGVPNDKISVVHSGIDPDRFKTESSHDYYQEFGISRHAKVIGNIAHMADHKGQRYLVEAAPLVLKKHPDTYFLIVGDGELRDDLEQRAHDLGVSERVLFPGFRRDVVGLLKFFDIFAMPSHLEGLGTSILDAMICKTPVVAAAAGGIIEIVKADVNGVLVPVRDPQALAEGIVRLLDLPEQAEKLAVNAYDHVLNHFTYKQMAASTLKKYASLL